MNDNKNMYSFILFNNKACGTRDTCGTLDTLDTPDTLGTPDTFCVSFLSSVTRSRNQ